MGVLEAIAIFAAGVIAGTINSVVGSGTLITFPVLLAFGYAPVVANVSNTVGLVPGNASGAVGYVSTYLLFQLDNAALERGRNRSSRPPS